jgi:hypothetical protein
MRQISLAIDPVQANRHGKLISPLRRPLRIIGIANLNVAFAESPKGMTRRMGRKFGFPGEKLIPWQLWMTMLKHIPRTREKIPARWIQSCSIMRGVWRASGAAAILVVAAPQVVYLLASLRLKLDFTLREDGQGTS